MSIVKVLSSGEKMLYFKGGHDGILYYDAT